jgi:DNA-binding winged helix-turn-helix (wHTH) protein
MSRFTFGPFLLDTESRALLREGESLPIAARTIDTLVILVQNRGRLLEKDELLSLIWPGTVVDEANLSQSIFTLRKLLGDSPKHHRYIVTVAGRGYQFVAPVSELRGESSAPADSASNPQAKPSLDSRPTVKWTGHRQRLAIATMAVMIGLAAAGSFWAVRHRPAKAPSELMERRLTFNSSASEVTSAVISPDGKYLAYSDMAGIHVRLLSTGEERLIPATTVAPAGASYWIVSWFPNGTELVGQSSESSGRVRMWAISIMGQSQRELRADTAGWSVSPEGTRIAFSPVIGGRN